MSRTLLTITLCLLLGTAALARDEGVILGTASQGKLSSVSPSPDSQHVVTVLHLHADLQTPFHISIDGREIAKIAMMVPDSLYWSPDSKAFGWWKKTEKGWVPIVTSIGGTNVDVGSEWFGTLAGGKTGWHNMSSEFSVGSTTIVHYFGADGRLYIGSEPQKKSEVATIHMAIAPEGKKLSYFVGTYETNKLTRWELFNGQKRIGPFEDIGLSALIFNPNGRSLAYAFVRGQSRSIKIGETEYGPYQGHTRVVFSDDGSQFAWGAMSKDKWYIFLNGKQAAGPFDDVDRCDFVKSGKLVYIVKRQDKLVAVTPTKEIALKDTNYVLGPYFSPDAKHFAAAIAQASHPWDSEVVVDDERAFGPFRALMSREGNNINLDRHGVLGLSWSSSKSGEAILTVLAVRDGKTVRMETHLRGE